YSEGGDLMDHISNHLSYYNVNKEIDIYAVPIQALLHKWLREKHEIHIVIDVYFLGNSQYEYEATTFSSLVEDGDEGNSETFDTYEEALEDGLIDALNLIKI